MFDRSRVRISGQEDMPAEDAGSVIREYNKPLQAQEIWKRYQPEIKRYGCWSYAFEILSQTKTPQALDTRLALMLAEEERSKQASSPEMPKKEDELEEIIFA